MIMTKTLEKQPEWLTDYRKKNLKIVQAKPLKKSSFFNVNKLNSWLEKKIKVTQINLPKHLEKKGLKVLSFQDALKEIPEKIRKVLEVEAKPKDQYEAFVNSHFTDGIVLIVPKNFTEKKLMRIELQLKENSVQKNFIFVEKEAEINFLEKISGKNVFLSEIVYCEDNCRPRIGRIMKQEGKNLFYGNSVLKRDANFKALNVYLNSEHIKINGQNKMIGEGSFCEQYDLILSDNQQVVDLNLTLLHDAENTKSTSVLKNVLFNKSKNIFNGMIKIKPKGQKTDALLQAHSMLLSADAVSDNIPSLEIEANDVKATHSASCAQVEDEKMFYLESKGIDKKTAKEMIVFGFLESLINLMPEFYAEEFNSALQEKWQTIDVYN